MGRRGIEANGADLGTGLSHEVWWWRDGIGELLLLKGVDVNDCCRVQLLCGGGASQVKGDGNGGGEEETEKHKNFRVVQSFHQGSCPSMYESV